MNKEEAKLAAALTAVVHGNRSSGRERDQLDWQASFRRLHHRTTGHKRVELSVAGAPSSRARTNTHNSKKVMKS